MKQDWDWAYEARSSKRRPSTRNGEENQIEMNHFSLRTIETNVPATNGDQNSGHIAASVSVSVAANATNFQATSINNINGNNNYLNNNNNHANDGFNNLNGNNHNNNNNNNFDFDRSLDFDDTGFEIDNDDMAELDEEYIQTMNPSGLIQVPTAPEDITVLNTRKEEEEEEDEKQKEELEKEQNHQAEEGIKKTEEID